MRIEVQGVRKRGRLEMKCMNYMMEDMKDYNINEQIIQNIAQLRKLVLNSDPRNERTRGNNYDKIENFPDIPQGHRKPGESFQPP